MKALICTLAAAMLFVSCRSNQVNIPEDMSPAKIIQRAQEASDTNKYKAALRYYEALLERYGNSGEFLSTAQYEIAFIRYKQKRYAEARRGFEELLALYEDDTVDGLLPQFRILAEKVLGRIKEKQKF